MKLDHYSGGIALEDLIKRVEKTWPDNHSKQNRALWNILSALRGPDTGSHETKQKFTGPIRAWISPEWNTAAGSSTHANIPGILELRALLSSTRDYAFGRTPNDCEHHYLMHICTALELMIDIEDAK